VEHLCIGTATASVLQLSTLITTTATAATARTAVLQSTLPMLCAAFAGLLQTIHWLRYGCLPVFVIEGQTPAAKLEKLRQR
jgi:hypothetical protein